MPRKYYDIRFKVKAMRTNKLYWSIKGLAYVTENVAVFHVPKHKIIVDIFAKAIDFCYKVIADTSKKLLDFILSLFCVKLNENN